MKIGKGLRKCRDYTAEAKDYLVKAFNLISLASREVPADDTKYKRFTHNLSDYLQDTFSRSQKKYEFCNRICRRSCPPYQLYRRKLEWLNGK